MKKEKLITLCTCILIVSLCTYFLLSVSRSSGAAYYDDTDIETKVNVTNKGLTVKDVSVYEYDDGDIDTIELSEGTTETIRCNATVDDWNGYSDIIYINATLYDSDNYNSRSANDNNYHYFTQTCTNASVNATAIKISCSFSVWYYANNASWNCNVSAMDSYNVSNTSVDASAPTIVGLVAIDLSTTVLDFGVMEPGETTLDADEQLVNVTNNGNTAFNVSVDGFGSVDGDELAMDCTVGNISNDFLKYNITSGETYLTNMYNLTDSQLPSGIPGLTVPVRTHDGDTLKVNSTDSTYWKLYIPIGSSRGFCNGSLTFAAVG